MIYLDYAASSPPWPEAARAVYESMLEPLSQMQAEGYSVTYVTPGRDGIVTPEAVSAALRPDTGLVCVQAVKRIYQ